MVNPFLPSRLRSTFDQTPAEGTSPASGVWHGFLKKINIQRVIASLFLFQFLVILVLGVACAGSNVCGSLATSSNLYGLIMVGGLGILWAEYARGGHSVKKGNVFNSFWRVAMLGKYCIFDMHLPDCMFTVSFLSLLVSFSYQYKCKFNIPAQRFSGVLWCSSCCDICSKINVYPESEFAD